MASILDAGLASIFSVIFVFLLVYALVWGALSRLKPFGDKQAGSYAIIALTTAFLMAIAPPTRQFIMFIAPWYLALAIAIFFILFIVGLFGLSAEKDFPNIIKDSKVKIWIVIVCVVVLLAGFAFTFGQQSLEATQGPAPVGTVPVAGATGTVGNGQEYYPPGTVVVTPGGTPTYPGTTYSPYPTAGQPGSTATPDFQANLVNTLIHPKVLGLMVTIFIAAVAIYFLSSG